MLKKLLAVLLIVSMTLAGFALAEEAAEAEHQSVVILYTNDVHCGVDDAIGYAGLAAYKKAYEGLGCEVLLVDNGDAIQGGPIGTLSKGAYIVDIMNELGYDVAIPGNHEFDYGMDQFMALREQAKFPYVSANFCDLEGNAILDPYVIKEAGGWKIAFVGASTPETFSKSTPTFFMDADGNFIYSFCGGDAGAPLYAAIQSAVDGARAEGADLVVLLSHLGIDGSSVPYTSSDLIVNTNGIDVVLDGHSHSVVESETVLNKDGGEVLLSSAGTKLQALGSLTITAGEEGPELACALHTETLFKDAEADAFIKGIQAQFEDLLNEVVATTAVGLTTKDPETDERAVRSAETNLGDLCADAYRSVLGADIAFVNGGGVRADIPAGEITYGQIISVHPFGNMACLIEATGQQILDALEMGARKLPDESGGFLQVSGLSYEIDVSVPSSVVADDADLFVEVAGERRVKNVTLADGEPIDPEATYKLASHNYMLKSGGDGMVMFKDDPILQDEVLIDNQVLINYIVDVLGGVVGEEYADPYGQGRITITE